MAFGLGVHQESGETRARIALARAVQIEAGVDVGLAGGDLAHGPPVQLNQRRGTLRDCWGNLRQPGRLGFLHLGCGACAAAAARAGPVAAGPAGHPGGWMTTGDRHLVDGAGGDPQVGLVGRDGAARLARLATLAAHCPVFCTVAFSGPAAASVGAGGGLGTSTKNLAGCLVVPASLPAASPDP